MQKRAVDLVISYQCPVPSISYSQLLQIAEMNVAVQRIRDYLLSEECRLPPRSQPVRQDVPPTQKKRVTIIGITFVNMCIIE